MRVLYVEDDLSVANAVEMMLASEAYECDTINSGKKAIELAKSNRYDIILLDLMLPDIDGYEVIKRLREAGIRTPFLIQTGVADHDNQQDRRPFGVTEYLVKPFNKADLIDRVKAVLSRPKLTPISEFTAEPETGDAMQAPSNDRRHSRRFDSMEPGKILHNEGIDCLILNMSPGGAAIELPDPDMYCPPAFDLQLSSGSILRSRMCWRFQDKVGVKGEIVGTHNGDVEGIALPDAAKSDALTPAELDQETTAPDLVVPETEKLNGVEQSVPATDRQQPPEISTVEAPALPPQREQESAAPSETPEADQITEEDIFTIECGVRLSAESCECAEVVVGGVFESAVRAKRLRVIAGGRFVGRAIVEQAEIAGTFEGDLIVQGRLSINGTGTVSGRTQCKEMVIELGGFIAGQVQRPATRAPAASSPSRSTNAMAPANSVATAT